MSRTFFDKVQAANILQQLWQRCGQEEFCDVVLIAGSERIRIPAHRYILSVASEYFDRVFNENTAKEVEISGLNGIILQRVIEYCYTGRIVINENYAVDLLKTAHKLFLRNLVTACENFLVDNIKPCNCFGISLLAERYSCEMLLEKAKDFCLKELLRIYGTGEFLSLSVEQMSQLLASDDLCVSTEEDVFKCLMKWIEFDKTERDKHKAELLKLVRMPLLEHSFLTKHVKPLCTTTECREIYMEALEWHLSPEINVFSENIITKPRGPEQRLMGLGRSKRNFNKMFIHYYCPQRNRWMKCLRELECRGEFGISVMGNDLFLAGGWDDDHYASNTVICLNLKTMNLKKISPMQERRRGCRAAALNGFLYVVGGWNGLSKLSTVEKFDPRTNKWEAVASMSIDRRNMGIAVLNQKLYVVGGQGGGVDELSSAECYDPKQNMWQSIASMAEGRQWHGVAVANGQLYAAGNFLKNTVERYDPQTNKWSVICSLSQESDFFDGCCATLRDKVVVCYNDHIEVYNSATNEWKKIVSFEHLHFCNVLSYSDELLTSELIES